MDYLKMTLRLALYTFLVFLVKGRFFMPFRRGHCDINVPHGQKILETAGLTNSATDEQ
jgi:hypothetical protein